MKSPYLETLCLERNRNPLKKKQYNSMFSDLLSTLKTSVKKSVM